MYKYIVVPGRHHALTNFQLTHLSDMLAAKVTTTLRGDTVGLAQISCVVWPITSANHSNTRRNPIAGFRRLGMLESVFSRSFAFPTQSYLIPNRDHKDDFAHYVLEEISLQSRGELQLTPHNTLVACSTPAVIAQYEALGFKIIPMELTNIATSSARARRPWDVIEEIIHSPADWRSNPVVLDELHPACLEYYGRYGLGDLIVEMYQDPLLSSEGDITDTRDYETYRNAFEENAFRKVAEFAPFVQPGRILDIGCATGQTIKLLTELPDLFESDFYGVEAARPLYEICQQRRDNGAFGTANVFFYQRNIMRGSLFPDNSLNTVITMALTHEIESYLGRKALGELLQRVYDMLAPGGVYINYDVVAPENKDRLVYVRFTTTDGENPEELSPPLAGPKEASFLRSLSTQARFHRFVQDFRKVEGDQMSYTTETIAGTPYYVMRYGDLCDFLAKKDYIDSWHSEMHERFCFWEHSDWVKALTQLGFKVEAVSKPIQNPWLIKNRFAPAAAMYTKAEDGTLKTLPSPTTNTLLVATKP